MVANRLLVSVFLVPTSSTPYLELHGKRAPLFFKALELLDLHFDQTFTPTASAKSKPRRVVPSRRTSDFLSINQLTLSNSQENTCTPLAMSIKPQITSQFQEEISSIQKNHSRRRESDTSSLSSISSADYAQVEARISQRRAQHGPPRVYEPIDSFEAVAVVEQPIATDLEREGLEVEKAQKPSRKRIRVPSDAESDYIPGDEEWKDEQNPKKKKKERRTEKLFGRQERPSKGSKAAPVPGSTEIQDASCQGVKYKHLPRCTACIAKKSGEPCRFRDIRAFVIDSDGKPSGEPIFYGIPSTAYIQTPPTELTYPTSWFSPPSAEHVKRIKSSVAQVLLPILQTEREKLIGKESITVHRMREMDVRVTCDRCLTSIFSTSFICTRCGRDFCIDCYEDLEAYTNSSLDARPPNFNPRYRTCGPSHRPYLHVSDDFLPVSRLGLADINRHILEMEVVSMDARQTLPIDSLQNAIVNCSVTPKGSSLTGIPSIGLDRGPAQLEDSHPISELDFPANHTPSATLPVQISSNGELVPRQTRPDADATGNVSLPVPYFHHSQLDDEEFRHLWSTGSTIVVTNLLEKMKIRWTPDYFIQNYGSEPCWITDCDNESRHLSNVQDFFSQFGNYSTREGKILKLKDWPPSADFRTTFPTLFDDFQSAVPAPNYTRRDGFYNIAAHFPTNIVAPDMGPKMYNAFASDEEKFGSTRLHMDMADAVNIMLYSSPRDGEDVGVAVWDIYPSGDANKLRTFLKEEFPPETSSVRYIDPIHSQHFYLTPQLRKKLYEKHGVQAWRIFQAPGDAVYIPAGCAHQVCNLADCIKVAVDFVSPENLERCSRLTSEFREENAILAWKDDILQLSNMCWSAWEHTSHLEQRLKEPLFPNGVS